MSKVFSEKCVDVLLSGGIAVILTDTVYGIVARAAGEKAVKRLYKLKNRVVDNPGPIIASNIDQLVELGIKRRYLKAVEQFWPGPISIEIPHNTEYLNLGTGRQAFRVVADKNLMELLDKTGPLLTTSANQTKKPPAVNIKEAEAYFGDQVDLYVDGGDLSGRPASTIIRIVDDAIEVVRQGAVRVDESGRILE